MWRRRAAADAGARRCPRLLRNWTNSRIGPCRRSTIRRYRYATPYYHACRHC